MTINAPSREYLSAYRALYGRPHSQDTQHGRFRRELLPDPSDYYAEHLGLNARGRTGWVSALCPFHDDKSPSLSVNLNHGGFRCYACDERGGNVLDFHIRRYGLSFQVAAKGLDAWT
jgi:hypothetical protein